MKMKVVGFVGLAGMAGLLGAATATRARGDELPGLTLKAALGRALAHNWDLLAARSDVDQATAQRILATEIQNPTASATLSGVPADGSSAATGLGNGFWQRSYESNVAVSQLLELHGKRALKRASAEAGLAGARARLDDARRVLDDAVIKAYATAALAEENGRRLAETAKSLRESARLAAIRFQAGDISSSDQKQIEVAADRFELDAGASATTARNARIALEVLLGEREARGEWRVADRLEDLAATAAALTTPPPQAEAERPDQAAARAALEKAEADLKLEKQRRLPDPTLDLQYDHEPPDRHNTVGFGIAIDLPLWHHREGEIAAATVTRDQAARDRERLAAAIASERSTARGTYEGALARWQSYRRTIVPKAEEVREAVVYAYQHGGASLLALLEAERNANEIRLAASQAAADTLSSAADLATSFNVRIFQGCTMKQLAFALLLLTILAPLGCKPQATTGAPAAGPRLEGDRILFAESSGELANLSVAPATPATLPALRTTARLAWNEDLTARVYPPVGGRVQRMIAGLEQRVGRGAPLAAIESADFGQAQADASRAATDLAAAQQNLDRQQSLYEHGAAARKELEAAQADARRSTVESQRAASRLTLLGGRPGGVDQRFVLRSPIAGVVVDRAINPGQEVRTDGQTPLFTVSDPASLWIYLDVTEKDMPHVRRGMSLAIRSAALPDRVFHGTLEVVGDTLDPATRTVKARGRIDNPDRLLKAEMYVDAEISDPAQHPGLEVPSAAVVADGGRHFVFVEEGKGRFYRRPVTPGPERSGRTQILAGLDQGQQVVVDGSLLLQSLLAARS